MAKRRGRPPHSSDVEADSPETGGVHEPVEPAEERGVSTVDIVESASEAEGIVNKSEWQPGSESEHPVASQGISTTFFVDFPGYVDTIEIDVPTGAIITTDAIIEGSTWNRARELPSGEGRASTSELIKAVWVAVDSLVRFFSYWLFVFPFGFDLDSRHGADRGLPFNAEKDAAGMFLTLAAFSLAQGGALATVAKGEGRDWVVLLLYAISVSLTMIVIVAMLRSTREGADEPPLADQAKAIRAYNRPTIRCGRWTLVWTLMLAVVIGGLAKAQLLPNQTRRIPYDRSEPIDIYPSRLLTLDDMFANQGVETTREENQRRNTNKWLQWMAHGRVSNPNQDQHRDFLLLRQKETFQDYFRDFPVTLNIEDKSYTLSEPVAFLVQGDDTWPYRPTYRTLPFRLGVDGYSPSLTLDVVKPNRGERLYVFVTITLPPNSNEPRNLDDYHITLHPHGDSSG